MTQRDASIVATSARTFASVFAKAAVESTFASQFCNMETRSASVRSGRIGTATVPVFATVPSSSSCSKQLGRIVAILSPLLRPKACKAFAS